MSKKVLSLICVALLVLSAVGLAACGSSTPASNTSNTTSNSSTSSLKTLTAGKLTIATGQPAYSPWVEDNKPESGKGFEAAVAYAIANKMGFKNSDVVWVRTDFDAAIAPGPKNFDLNLQQYSITPERQKVVDFSSPYYTTAQAIVTYSNSQYASATTVAAFQDAKIGVAAGSTSLTLAQRLFKNVSPFNDNDTAVQALKSGQIDAIVVDIPTAWYITGAELDNSKIVGELPSEDTQGDQLACLLPKNSPLTSAVSKAVDELRSDGTLSKLENQWLLSGGSIPMLK